MITVNILQRVFQVLHNQSTGTCFTIEVDGRQYIVSARHLLGDIQSTKSVRMFHNNEWKTIDLTLVGHCSGEIDISVFSTNFQLSPAFPAEPTSEGIAYAQDMYFLGFPYGMYSEGGDINRQFPLPFVKKAILSCITGKLHGAQVLYLDGHNNPGFSGGPAIFRLNNSRNFRIAGVVSGFRYTEEPIYDKENPLPFAYKYNTGIVVCYGINHAVELSRKNPIGFQI